MSFILDALKKSEIERQRQTVPGLMDSRMTERRGRLPIWAIAIGALLGINLFVLSFVLLRKNPPAAANSAAPLAQHFSPLDPSPVYAPEIPVPAAEIPAAASPGVPAKAAAHAGRHADPLLSDADASAEKQEILPSISEINLTGAQALPELHLDVHVFSTKPADRFVYVNMRKYHEGAVLQEGPMVERIRRDGVVLNSNGLRFFVPRQS